MGEGPLRLLVVQNDVDKPAGRFGDALVDRGVLLEVASSADRLPPLDRFDGLIVLSGLADPVDADRPVGETRALIGDALARGLPVLGLCLGGQLLAQAAGGSVYRCRDELGYREVELTAEAADDPLLSGLAGTFTGFHAHRYAFRPPTGATVLARNDVCVQAFRFGEAAWGFQFHPEATVGWVEQLARNVRNGAEGVPARTAGFFRESGIDPDRLLAGARAADSSADRIAVAIASGFAACCWARRARAGGRR